jgi:hypothetical protein
MEALEHDSQRGTFGSRGYVDVKTKPDGTKEEAFWQLLDQSINLFQTSLLVDTGTKYMHDTLDKLLRGDATGIL